MYNVHLVTGFKDQQRNYYTIRHSYYFFPTLYITPVDLTEIKQEKK